MNNNRLMALILSLVMLMTVAAPSAALADEDAGGGTGIEVVTTAEAQPEPEKVTVKFVANGNQIGSSAKITKGSTLSDAGVHIPTEDDIESDKDYYKVGGIFKGWDHNTSAAIDSDTTFAAEYADKSVTVTYVESVKAPDDTSNPVAVKYHDSPKPPTAKDNYLGYSFAGWIPELKNVIKDEIVTAQYKSEPDLKVKFYAMVDGDETTIPVGVSDQTVQYHGSLKLKDFKPDASVVSGDVTYELKDPSDPWSNVNLDDITEDIIVYANYGEKTRNNIKIGSKTLSYTAKQGETITIAIPILCIDTLSNNKDEYRTNVGADGSTLIKDYDTERPLSEYDQSVFCKATGITRMEITLQNKSHPFTKVASDKIIQKYSENKQYFEDAGITGVSSINKGFAVFELTVSGSAKAKTYDVPFVVEWDDAQKKGLKTIVYVPVKVTKKSSSSSSGGSGGGGGSSGESTPLPDTRLYIKDVSTDPAHPKAGDEFTIRMELVNTNAKRYLHNMQISWTAADDVLVPWGTETNVKYIEKIDKSGTYIWEFKVKSLPELASKQVKMDIAMECQDSKMTAISETQTVNVEVLPLQRIKIDELKLPTGSIIAGDDYSISVVVANAGKTILNNLNARIVTDNPDLVPGSSFYGGNLESGQSKTIELDCTPIEAGAYDAYVEITYEDENGNVTADSTSKKEFSLAAAPVEDEDMGWMEEIDPADIQPQQPAVTARSIMAMLPAWLYAALGALLLLLIVSMSVSARKRRRRAMEDDEME